MKAGPFARKALLTAHIATSVGLIGSIAGFLVLAIVGLAGGADGTVAFPAMGILTRTLIVPLAIVSIVIGTAQAVLTQWGLFRHFWVLIKLILTVGVTIVLLLQLDQIDMLAALSSEAVDEDRWGAAKASMVLHASGGLIVLMTTVILSVYKPRGLTRYGWNRRNA